MGKAGMMVEKEERISTGLGLDSAIGGGFPAHSTILLSGGPGTGKTILGISFLAEGLRNGENCVYITVGERAENILRACDNIDSLRIVKEEAKRGGRLLIEKVDIESRGPAYLSAIFSGSYGLNTSRLVIDSLNSLLDYSQESEYKKNLIRLVNSLQEKIKCSLLICETDGKGNDSGNGEAFICDGVVNLSFQHTGEADRPPPRTLEVSKLRWTSFDSHAKYPFIIDGEGMKMFLDRKWF